MSHICMDDFLALGVIPLTGTQGDPISVHHLGPSLQLQHQQTNVCQLHDSARKIMTRWFLAQYRHHANVFVKFVKLARHPVQFFEVEGRKNTYGFGYDDDYVDAIMTFFSLSPSL